MSEVNTTHALSCLQRVGETCDCWVKDADMIAEEILGPEEAPAEELHRADCDCVISLSRACDCTAFCTTHRHWFALVDGCELCREEAEMTGTKLDESAFCDKCGEHKDQAHACWNTEPPRTGEEALAEVHAYVMAPLIAKTEELLSKHAPVRAKVLQRGIDLTTGDRNKTYGPPEPNLTLQMEFWKLYKGMAGDKHSMAHDAAMQHVFAKLARIASGPPLHEDNYVDLSTYSAIAYECDVEVLGVES